MLKKSLTTLAAGALLAASSAATAQSAVVSAPQPAIETVGEAGENRLMGGDVATTLGVLFGIFVLVIFVWGSGDGDGDDEPISP